MSSPDLNDEVLQRELAYHEKLYSGFAQQHFARPAVRALRTHMVNRILYVTGAGASSRVLSIGCGIGDTEILLAPHVGELTGIDLSPTAIRQAREDAARAGLHNTEFREGSLDEVTGKFDLVFGVFFLHHLPDALLEQAPAQIAKLLNPGGVFYALDPNHYRLSGAIGKLIIPSMMRKYQTHDERELRPGPTAELFRKAGFDTRVEFYDFLSSPMAGLFPGWRAGYLATRALDEVLRRAPVFRHAGSNFEIIARKPR